MADNKRRNVRAVAAGIITAVTEKQRSLSTVLQQALSEVSEQDRGLCQQLCYGVLRWHPTLQNLSTQLLQKPFRAKDKDIEALLLLGIYQLRGMRTPPHAAISETVDAAKQLKKPWATGLLNACLRNYQRNSVTLEANLETNPVTSLAHPPWLLEQYTADWPDNWHQIAKANNDQPPMVIRINQQKSSPQAYLGELEQHNINATMLPAVPSAIQLAQAQDVNALPGFKQGYCSVQDGAAQLAGNLLKIEPGQRILDACAAPGGKTCHILEQVPENRVTAIDIDAERLKQIQQNLDRLGLSAELIAEDAANTARWWDGELFDRILIDAPCTGSGVIRRHPDIKLLRRPEDINLLAQKQQQLLEELWQLLKPNGIMLYTTCSVFKRENEEQIAKFLQKHSDARELACEPPPASQRPHGYQRLPGDDGMDGFFYALLQRV